MSKKGEEVSHYEPHIDQVDLNGVKHPVILVIGVLGTILEMVFPWSNGYEEARQKIEE